MAIFKAIKISNALNPAKNNFDLLRLCAAIAVMFGHSFWIQPAKGYTEPLLGYTGIEYSGSLAVYAFFLISGILVSSSFERQKSLGAFMALRLIRIYPGLIFCILVTTFAIYPTLSANEYFATATSKDAINYLTTNIGLFFNTQWGLPGLFATAPLNTVVNGSLWTLPLEMKCYLLVVIAGLCGCFRSRALSLAFFLVTGSTFAYLVANGTSINFLSSFTIKPAGYSFYPAPFFLIGMLIYILRDTISVNWTVGALLASTYIALRTTEFGPPFFYMTFIYILLLFSVEPRLLRFRPKHDYSYGVYVWAFLIQQVVASRYPEMNNILSLTITIPATLVVAAISWHLIERPSIKIVRDRLSNKRLAINARPKNPKETTLGS